MPLPHLPFFQQEKRPFGRLSQLAIFSCYHHSTFRRQKTEQKRNKNGTKCPLKNPLKVG
nr:MAG TPA: hypothetical protein [Caudoviricetes sp.]